MIEANMPIAPTASGNMIAAIWSSSCPANTMAAKAIGATSEPT